MKDRSILVLSGITVGVLSERILAAIITKDSSLLASTLIGVVALLQAIMIIIGDIQIRTQRKMNDRSDWNAESR